MANFGTGMYGNARVPYANVDDVPELTAEQVRLAYEQALAADSKLAARHQSADAFVTLHPEFLDTPSNGEAMNRTLQTMYGDVAFTVEQMEAAYQVLRVNNSLELDKAEIAKQQQAAANQRAKEARARRAAETRVYSEDEKYSMSLEELRQLENREIQQRMQLAGERGGNGW